MAVLCTFPEEGGGSFTTDFCESVEAARVRALERAKEMGFTTVNWSKDGRSAATDEQGEKPWTYRAAFWLMTEKEYDRFMSGDEDQ